MDEQAELKWGETHWDNMTREELLRETQRMYVTIQSLYWLAKMIRHSAGDTPFWGKGGTGGVAFEMGRQVLEPIWQTYDDSDPMYQGFFRYARDLLFEDTGYEIGFGWAVCSECGVMLGKTAGSQSNRLIGKPCSESGFGKQGCNGTFRKLEWGDLSPEHKKDGGD